MIRLPSPTGPLLVTVIILSCGWGVSAVGSAASANAKVSAAKSRVYVSPKVRGLTNSQEPRQMLSEKSNKGH